MRGLARTVHTAATFSESENLQMKLAAAGAFLIAPLFVLEPARAQGAEPPRTPALPQVAADTPAGTFGAKGQLAVSSDAGLAISNTSQSGGNGSTTTLTLHPAIDYFVVDNFTIG